MALHDVFIFEVKISLQSRPHTLTAHPGTSVIQCNSYQVTTNVLYMNSSAPDVQRQFLLPHFDGILESYVCSYK
jgi:hypothetical protein